MRTGKQLMLVKPGATTEAQRKKLEKQGCIVVETSDFEAFKLLNTEFMLTTDTFAMAALETLVESLGYGDKENFARKILKAMRAQAGILPEPKTK